MSSGGTWKFGRTRCGQLEGIYQGGTIKLGVAISFTREHSHMVQAPLISTGSQEGKGSVVTWHGGGVIYKTNAGTETSS